jgi:hypothetical protein
MNEESKAVVLSKPKRWFFSHVFGTKRGAEYAKIPDGVIGKVLNFVTKGKLSKIFTEVTK